MSTDSIQKIGVSTAVIIGMNAMIGAGIFGIIKLLASNVGPAGILTYLFALTSVWFMAQSIARVAYLYPQEGSFYNYAKQWGGHYLGLASAGAYLVGLLIAMGFLCKEGGSYLHSIFPQISAYNLGLITLGVLVLFNIMGMVLSQLGQYILIICTVFPLITTTIICLTKVDISHLVPFMPYGPESVITGTKAAIFGLFGFECTASLFNIVKNPEKNVPKALKYSLLIVGSIYFLFISSIILSIPLEIFRSSPSITLTQALQVVFPNSNFILMMITLSILSATIGTVHSMIWSSSELMLSYFKTMKIPSLNQAINNGTVNNKTTVIIAGLAILTSYVFCNNADIFFGMTAVAIIFAFLSSMMPLFLLKSEWDSGQNYKTLFGFITALIIFGTAVQSLINHLIAAI